MDNVKGIGRLLLEAIYKVADSTDASDVIVSSLYLNPSCRCILNLLQMHILLCMKPDQQAIGLWSLSSKLDCHFRQGSLRRRVSYLLSKACPAV